MSKCVSVIALSFGTLCYSQNTSPYWSLAGNSNATATSKMGTTNSTPLKFFTNNFERMQITADGKVAVGTATSFIGKLTVFNNGSNPSNAWFRSSPPIFMGFGEGSSGNADLLLGMSSNNSFARPVFFGRRARGTLANPTVVQTNDYLSSFLVSGYDGSLFQNPASIDFYVDATPSSGHVPTRLSLVTGTSVNDRKERLKIGYTGNFDFNNGQVFLNQSTGFLGIGTTSPSSKLHVKGNVDASQLIIDANATQSNTNPLIRLRNPAGTDLLHIHSDDPSNVFIGLNAGKQNTIYQGQSIANTFIGSNSGASNKYGSYNTASGDHSLYSNIDGYSNTASGYFALYGNTYGHGNAGFGTNALNSNTSGIYNSAFGYAALYSTSTGTYNTACGSAALYDNNGSYNTATGFEALRLNRESYNAAFGYQALRNTIASQYNVAFGYQAGWSLDNGYNNVFLGANTNVNGIGYYNVIAIGQATVCTAPSQVTMGNPATGSYRAYANWSNISDGRYKKNVKEDVPGLSFINKLRPVTYNLDATGLENFLNKSITNKGEVSANAKAIMDKAFKEKGDIVQTGFIAQEVEKSAREIGFDFSGVDAAKNENDIYGLRYAEFVVPLVKAVQELSAENDALKKEVDELKALVESLAKKQEYRNSVSSTAFLRQNAPNPFKTNTVIGYYIPENVGNAQIRVTDVKGRLIKIFNAARGDGQINMSNSGLAAGTYNYSLYINGKAVDTKQMVLLQ